ncbi:MAG: hypothetical protein HY704_17625 [Gemmatimonadetes bacterium]|nr:hypothetical protein [Gemmatimonadota bacterium]
MTARAATDAMIERALALAARQPGRAIPLGELAAALVCEFPGLVRSDMQLASWLARHPARVRVVRAGHASWEAWAAWPEALQARYQEALRSAGIPLTLYVVALRPPAEDASRSSRPIVLERLDATVAALAGELDDGASLAAARWGRLRLEAHRLRRALGEPDRQRAVHG